MKQSLHTTNPELSKPWHPTKNTPLTPNDVTTGSNKKVWWFYSRGHEWQAIVNSRNQGRVLRDREAALTAHSVRPHQIQEIEELEEKIAALEKELEELSEK